MPPRKVDFKGMGDYAREEEEKAADEAEEKRIAEERLKGPPLDRCHCGQFAPYARGNFGKPDDKPQYFCFEHAPLSLRNPEAFAKKIQKVRLIDE